jgi:hypothetical protein
MTTYDTELCLSSTLCHTFTIEDTYGDGIRISDGGDFSVIVDNQEILSLPRPDSFAYSLSKQFGQCNTPPTPTAPTPTAPTPTAPTPTAPTPTPPVSCPSGQLDVAVSVTTDDYPGEIAWKIVSSSGQTINSDIYEDTQSTYTKNLCLASTACYTFTISDEYGDGILSPGSFSVKVNGSVKLSMPNDGFTYTMTTKFGQCDETVPCAATKSRVNVYIKTDNYGSETSFKVMMKRANGKFNRKVFAGSGFSSTSEYDRSKCLAKNQCYKLIVFDSVGDGMCCEYGEGSFQAAWKGKFDELF